MYSKNTSILIIIALIAFSIILNHFYILLHELSHAFIAVLFGSKITALSIFDAFVRYEHSDNFNMIYYPIIILAGSLIPTLLIIGLSVFYKYKANYTFLRVIFGIFSFLVIYSNLQWVFGPFYYFLGVGRNPETYGSWNFDSYGFITHTGFPPLLVLLIALLIIIIHIFVLWKKNILTSINTLLWWYPVKKHFMFICITIIIIIFRAYSIEVYLRT